MNKLKTLLNGLMKENPVFVLLLGMCPTLGVSSSAINGIGMGLATTFVLVMSNVMVSLVAGFIPDKVRIPSYVVIIATFVTIVQLSMQAYLPSLFASLGLFIPLIVVNCIVLGRAEAFASKNSVFSATFDGLGMGLGFTFALTLLGSIREFLGTGSIFGISIYPEDFGSLIFVLAPGAFIVLGYLIAVINKIKKSLIVMEYIIIIISAILVNNIVLAQFLGICPFLGVSKSTSTAIGMAGAVAFVMTLATIVTYLIQYYILNPFNIAYLQTISFILVIAALVQLVEIILKKVSPALYQALGVFLPLITTNCTILGVAILTITKEYNLIEGVVFAISTATGFGLSLVIFAGIREQLELMNIPKGLKGTPIALITAGILAMAFMGFSGMV